MPVPLTLLKARLRIDHDADDTLLAHLTEAAEAYVARFLGKPLPDPLPADLIEAVMLLVGSWYDGETMAPAPYGVGELLRSHAEAVTGHIPPVVEVTP